MSRDAFANLSHPCGCSKARAFDLRAHLAAVARSARESCTPFGGPRRSHLSTLPTCSTHELANSCSHFRVLTFAQRVRLFHEKLAPLARTRHARVWLRLATLPNTPTARVHLQRIVIEKVWPPRLRCRRLEATLLELLSLPTRPPGTRVLRLSPQPPRTRKISPTRLAVLLTQ